MMFGTLHSHVRLGDPPPFELVADQVADDEQIVTGGVTGRGEDDREPTLQVEAEGRRVAEAEVEGEDGDHDADGRGDPRPQPAADHSAVSPVDLSAVESGSSGLPLASGAGPPLVFVLPAIAPRDSRICTSSSTSSQTRSSSNPVMKP